jgi:hypothetical protein
MKQKEEAYLNEQREKQRMEQLVKEMETRLMKGGGGDENEKKKYSALRNKLKK